MNLVFARVHALLVAVCGVAALVVLASVADSAWLVTHITGLLVMLAEALRDGVFYPAHATPELAYSTFYQPLAFAPVALLPGHGLDLVRGLRWLVGCETLALLGTCFALARAQGAGTRVASLCVPWALCSLPCTFALVGMRDDARATLLAFAALLPLVLRWRLGPELAGSLLGAAFFTKITAPAAAGLAGLVLAFGSGRTRGLRFVASSALAIGVPFAILQVAGADLWGIVVRASVLEPTFTPRGWGTTLTTLLVDLVQLEGLHLAAGAIVACSIALAALRLARARPNAFDVLVLASLAKTLYVYRHPGTDLNHLLEPTLAATLHLVVVGGAWWTPARGVVAIALLFAIGRPHEVLLPLRAAPALSAGPAVLVATALRQLPAAGPTLVEDPLVALLAGVTPRVPDPSTVGGVLRRQPEIARAWFGPLGTPGALHRIVLMHDPFAPRGSFDPSRWYGVVAYDAAFLAELRAHWKVVVTSDSACVLERR